jgi:hypothetical protein
MHKQIEFSVEEIKRFMFEELTDLGMVPGDEELEAVAEIAFDYILDKILQLEDDEENADA